MLTTNHVEIRSRKTVIEPLSDQDRLTVNSCVPAIVD